MGAHPGQRRPYHSLSSGPGARLVGPQPEPCPGSRSSPVSPGILLVGRSSPGPGGFVLQAGLHCWGRPLAPALPLVPGGQDLGSLRTDGSLQAAGVRGLTSRAQPGANMSQGHEAGGGWQPWWAVMEAAW